MPFSVIIKSIGKVWSNKEYFLRKFPIAHSTCIQTLEIILVLSISSALNCSFSFVNDGISSLAPNVLTVSASLPSLCHHKLNISKNQNFLSQKHIVPCGVMPISYFTMLLFLYDQVRDLAIKLVGLLICSSKQSIIVVIFVPTLVRKHIGIEAINSERSGQTIIGVNFS